MDINGDKRIGDLTVNEFLALNKIVKMDDSKLLNVKEASEHFSLSPKTIYAKVSFQPELIKRNKKGDNIRASIKDWKKVLQ